MIVNYNPMMTLTFTPLKRKSKAEGFYFYTAWLMTLTFTPLERKKNKAEGFYFYAVQVRSCDCTEGIDVGMAIQAGDYSKVS